MKHKVISILQPWASLIVLGHKRIETRSWNTNYRGPLLIHASLGMKEAKQLCSTNMDCNNPFSIADHWAELPFGAIIGSVNLVDTCRSEIIMSDKYINEFKWPRVNKTSEEAFGDYSPGRYGWLLSDPVIFDTPIPAKGHLGIWEWDY